MLLKYGVPLLVTVGLCFMLFTGVDIREMIRIVRSDCNFFWKIFSLIAGHHFAKSS